MTRPDSEHPEGRMVKLEIAGSRKEMRTVRRALRRCRQVHERAGEPPRPDWYYLEIIMARYILAHGTPEMCAQLPEELRERAMRLRGEDGRR